MPMDEERAAGDAELKEWLKTLFPVLVASLNLPRSMEAAARRGLELLPMGVTLRWADMLGLGRSDHIRRLPQRAPDAAASLASSEGQRAVGEWEATHQVTPVMRSLEGAAKAVRSLGRRGGRPQRAVLRALAALSLSQIAAGGQELRARVVSAIGAPGDSAATLLHGYTEIVMVDQRVKIQAIDRVLSSSPIFGPWLRSLWLCLKLRRRGKRQGQHRDCPPEHALWSLSLILREIAGVRGQGRRGG